jgi:hypothetical protein
MLFVVVTVPVPHTQAGVYSPDEPMPFQVGPDGAAKDVTYLPTFKILLDERLNASNPAVPDVQKLEGKDVTTYRGRLRGRIAERLPRVESLSPADLSGLASDLLRVGRDRDALNVLEPRKRDRMPDFRVIATLAHVHATRGEWDEALRWHGLALFDCPFPDDLPGTTPEQRKWLEKVERDYYHRWLRFRQQESTRREPPESQNVDPLFPAAGSEPVRFVNEQGEYEPGKLAAAERAKLPPDAIAIVQQLLLWSPGDTRLLWLLGELFAADGRFEEADRVFDDCTWGRGFTNRRILMEHRRAVADAAAEARRNQPTDVPLLSDDPPARPNPPERGLLEALGLSRGQVFAVVAVFGVVAVVLLALQVRAISRRWRGSGPTG